MSEITQISVFIENRAGRAAEVTSVLREAQVDVRGYMISDTLDYGILRYVVDKPEVAAQALQDAGFNIRCTPILVARLGDQPGGLANLFEQIANAQVSMIYSYSLISTFVAISVEDVVSSRKSLENGGVELLTQEELAGLSHYA